MKEGSFLGVIGILVAALIIYVLVSGSSKLSKQEKIVCAVWVFILILLCKKIM